MKLCESTNPFDSCWDARFEMFKRLNDLVLAFCQSEGLPFPTHFNAQTVDLMHNTSKEIGELIETRSTDFDI